MELNLFTFFIVVLHCTQEYFIYKTVATLCWEETGQSIAKTHDHLQVAVRPSPHTTGGETRKAELALTVAIERKS